MMREVTPHVSRGKLERRSMLKDAGVIWEQAKLTAGNRVRWKCLSKKSFNHSVIQCSVDLHALISFMEACFSNFSESNICIGILFSKHISKNDRGGNYHFDQSNNVHTWPVFRNVLLRNTSSSALLTYVFFFLVIHCIPIPIHIQYAYMLTNFSSLIQFQNWQRKGIWRKIDDSLQTLMSFCFCFCFILPPKALAGMSIWMRTKRRLNLQPADGECCSICIIP